jgi:hypothetical protein
MGVGGQEENKAEHNRQGREGEEEPGEYPSTGVLGTGAGHGVVLWFGFFWVLAKNNAPASCLPRRGRCTWWPYPVTPRTFYRLRFFAGEDAVKHRDEVA